MGIDPLAASPAIGIVLLLSALPCTLVGASGCSDGVLKDSGKDGRSADTRLRDVKGADSPLPGDAKPDLARKGDLAKSDAVTSPLDAKPAEVAKKADLARDAKKNDLGKKADLARDAKPAPDSTPVSGTEIPKAYVTGYSWYDNTPPGSATISHPQIHQTAGGTGTWADPITVAVGHDLSSGKDVLDYPAGTRFYIPDFRRYFIVEDTCGDGPTPQNGPCHVPPSGASTWLDIWIGGASGTKASTDACMNKLTGIHQVVLNPDPYRSVDEGEVFSNGSCQL